MHSRYYCSAVYKYTYIVFFTLRNYFSLEFEIPMYICSGLQIRYLRVQDRDKAYSPFRWVRYITHR